MTTVALPILQATPESQRGFRAGIQWLTAACLAVGLIGRLVYLKRTFDHDASMFIYLGKAVADGMRFGQDILDNKFPSVGLMTSIPWRMFGTNWWGYVMLQTMLSLVAALMLGRCARRNAGEHAYYPTLLASIVYLNFTPGVFGGFQLETLQIFFSVLAACGAIEAISTRSNGDAFLVGLAAGTAAWLKPSGLAPLGAFAIVLVGRPAHTRLLAMALLGTLLPGLGALVYILQTGILQDMPALYRQISLYASATPLAWEDLLRPVVILVLAGFGIVIRLWVFRRGAHRSESTPDRRMIAFAIVWFVFELAGAVLQRRMYAYHFLPVAAPAALLFGILPRRNESLPLLASLAPVMALSMISAAQIQPYPDPSNDLMPVSAYLRQHTTRGDTVWQDPVARILLETDLKPASRFPSLFLFGNYDYATNDYLPVLLRDFEQRRPKFLVLPTDVELRIKLETTQAAHLARSPVRAQNYAYAWHEVQDYARRYYFPETQIGLETVYRRRD